MKKEKSDFGISRIAKAPGIPTMVAEQIIDLISEGKLKPGDKLPSEQEMTELFGISRISLREAMKLLEAKGFIESQDRKGKFVKSVVDGMRNPIEDMIQIDHRKIWELLAVRRIIDSEMAALAAVNATKRHIQQLQKVIEEARRMSLDTVLFTKEGGRFYSDLFDILADATKNTIFVHIRQTIASVLKGAFPYSRKKLSYVKGSSEQITHQLYQIYEAILNKDPVAAKRATQEHIDYVEQSLRKAITLEGSGALR